MANNNQKPGDKERAVIDLADLTPEQAARAYDDGSDSYANERDYYIYIKRDQGKIKVHVKFKAFVTSFTDTYDPQFSDEESTQGDTAKRQKKVMRKVALSFDVIASTYEEAKLNLSRMAQLGRAMYQQNVGNNKARAAKFKIKFANLIRGRYPSSYLDGYIE